MNWAYHADMSLCSEVCMLNVYCVYVCIECHGLDLYVGKCEMFVEMYHGLTCLTVYDADSSKAFCRVVCIT